MPSTCSSFIPKKEFTKVITDSNLTSTPTPHSREFYSILTGTSLLDTETFISPIPHINLIKYYGQMFPTLKSYKNFMDRRLGIWEHDLQVKYSDSLYRHQWATTNSIKILHNQVQKLLEEANRLQERKHYLWQEIDYHLHTITQPKLCRHLYKPYKVQPRPSIPQYNLLNRYHLPLDQPSIQILIPRNEQSFIASNATAWPTSNGTVLNIAVDIAKMWHPAICNKIVPKTDCNPMMTDSMDIMILKEKMMEIWMGNAENTW